MLVPRVTNVIAFRLSLRPIMHPNILAKSHIRVVMKPRNARERKKVGHPFRYLGGGIIANNTFQ